MAAVEKLERVFAEFRFTAFRLEAQAAYSDDQDPEDWALFLVGKPMTKRSPETEPWLELESLWPEGPRIGG